MKDVMIAAAVFLLLTALGSGQTSPQIASLASLADIRTDLGSVECDNDKRMIAVRAQFQKVGVPESEIAIGPKGPKNIRVVVRGKSDETIVVGAHYDHVGGGCGAIDNWTGIVAISRILGTVHALTPAKTVEFIAFDREEQGLLGSGAFVDDIPKESLSRYCAMINLDSFSTGAPFVMSNASSDKLGKLVEQTAKDMKIPFGNLPIPSAASDSTSFLQRKIPAVTISGLDDEWQSVLHTSRDQVNRIKAESVYLGYRLSLAVLQRLDQAPCGQYR